MSKPISKTILAEKYGLSYSSLQRLLNQVFFDELKEVGYTTSSKILPPKVVKKFIDLYGSPNDFEL